MTTAGYMALDRRSFVDRLWSRLGFGRRHCERPDDLEGFAPSYLMTNVITHLDWRDRLRVLVSGKVQVETCTKTDVTVAKSVSNSTFSVLPPA